LHKFKANPAAYLPQFSGFCAMGTAHGHKLEGDPNVWGIVDKRFYLNNNPDVGKRWIFPATSRTPTTTGHRSKIRPPRNSSNSVEQ
jgi:hypothetical protein